jgi:hypothetical protein
MIFFLCSDESDQHKSHDSAQASQYYSEMAEQIMKSLPSCIFVSDLWMGSGSFYLGLMGRNKSLRESYKDLVLAISPLIFSGDECRFILDRCEGVILKRRIQEVSSCHNGPSGVVWFSPDNGPSYPYN